MRQQRHLLLFVKAPRLGAVKTRLAADIGVLEAWRFYRQTVTKTLARLSRDRRWRCRMCITPDRFARPGDLAQGIGDLGSRMGRAFHTMPPGPMVIIGGDIPDIERRDIAQAFRELERNDMVFGPSSDGGYWLVGARRRRPLPRGLFRNVRWSSRHALADTVNSLGARCQIAMVRERSDIDHGDDYRRWRSAGRA